MSDTAVVRLFHPKHPKGVEFDPVEAATKVAEGWTDRPVTRAAAQADVEPAPVRLFHPKHPGGHEFDAVTAETMRHQGWTDEPDSDEVEPEGDEPDTTEPSGSPEHQQENH